jgi:uncharacterized protein GlcG (DUF336 family)
MSARPTDPASPLPRSTFCEPLEGRTLMSSGQQDVNLNGITGNPSQNATIKNPGTPTVASATGSLSAADVRKILGQAGSQMKSGQAVAVVDREGIILGIYATTAATDATIQAAAARARTGAFFESTQNAFTTRTARFIIQDHFPYNIRNTAGGPLYGVEFSSLRGTDMLSAAQTPGISGDPGGMPLYKGTVPVGGIGVAGDGRDLAPRPDLATAGQKAYTGAEESDFDESVAISGSVGYAAPYGIQATNVFLPGPGLRFPYTNSPAATGKAKRTLDQLIAAGAGNLAASAALGNSATIIASPPSTNPKVGASVFGVPGELKNTNVAGKGLIDSNDTDSTGTTLPSSQRLTTTDVRQIIRQAVKGATQVRAAIRLNRGVPAVVHIAVVDRDGTVLGVFRMNDGTNFSFDVAVQKARTAAFFSDNTHAFSTRAIGTLSQQFFPAGLQDTGRTGPLYHLQNELAASPANNKGPLANNITIFPGGVPLYKNGVMVGAIGISGDGVEQDDQIAYSGATNFQPRNVIRSDYLSAASVTSFITARVQTIQNTYTLTTDFVTQASRELKLGLNFRLPYVKFSRNSLV